MGDLTAPVELLLLINFFGTGMAYWAGRESGRAKEQRVRRVHVDDAFRRGKQSGYAFLDTIDVARTEAMSSVRVFEDAVTSHECKMSPAVIIGGDPHIRTFCSICDREMTGESAEQRPFDYEPPDL